ncbi:MAG: L-2-amino-thiazoline-4-carboxylic acid hydrolase [Myxococcales bacterium]|nr:L-2-amino-thiazoline-4-carboxylic acid hydrolase [Myxococcales bacterium]
MQDRDRDRDLEALLDASEAGASEALGPGGHARLVDLARARHRPLAAAAPRFKQTLNRGLFALAVPLLAIYRALRDDLDMSEETALSLVAAIIDARYRRLGASRAVRIGYGFVLKSRLVRGYLRRALPRLASEDGFRMELRDDEDAGERGVLALDVRECAIVRYLREQGAPELGPQICRIDDLMAALVDDVVLEREGTIATGAARCEFRYRRR